MDSVAIYMYITIIFKHLRNHLANQSQILCVHENPGHMTKMATMPIYGKNRNYFSFCPDTVLVDSQVSDCCP